MWRTACSAGDSLAAALEPEAKHFPDLFLILLAVGEESGRLTQVLGELEQHFAAVVSAEKQFRQALIYPGFVYISAIGVVTLLLFILGSITTAGGQPFDPLGLGLLGPAGALAFLAAATLATGLAVLVFLLLKNHDGLRPRWEALGSGIPGLAGCLQAFALQRFALALSLTLEAGLPPHRGLAQAFQATANARYRAEATEVQRRVRAGSAIPRALAACRPGLFPDDFLDAVGVGDITGNLPEVMAKQAEYYRGEALRGMKFLTQVAGGLVYAAVALLIIAVIVRLIMGVSAGYQDALRGV